MRMSQFGLGFRRGGADDRCTEGGRRLTQAHLTRRGLTDFDRCPLQNRFRATTSIP